MSEPIENFISGNLHNAKARIFAKIENGGLGLTEIQKFLNYQKCGWLKLSLTLDSNWKRALFCHSGGNILNVKPKTLTDCVILKGMAETLETLSSVHFKINNNFRKSFIYENQHIKITSRPIKVFDDNFFSQCQVIENRANHKKIKFNDIMDGNNIRQVHEILERTGFMLNLDQREKLQMACRSVIRKHKKTDPDQSTCTSLPCLFNLQIKGKKTFKSILTYKKSF